MNHHNRPMRNRSSKFKGVSWNKSRRIWKVQIQFEGQRKYLGGFTDEIEVAKAYNTAALEYFGPNTYFNSFEESVEPEPGDTQQIPLQHGEFAVVDHVDYEFLMKRNWRLTPGRVNIVKTGNVNALFMGCLVLKRKFNQDDLGGVNYIDGNPLNNCRNNLRLATVSQSQMTQKPRKGCSSKFKGVVWVKRRKRWSAAICKDSKTTYLGYFIDEIKAAEAYNRAALELFGEFARVNTFEEVVA